MKKGFTLSEVIITLGIIGVIAGLTIPAIVNNYRYKIYSSQLKKTYSQLETATENVMSDEMSDSFYKTTAGTKSGADCMKGPCYFLTNYFKVSRTNCGYKSTKKCVSDKYVTINGSNAGKLISSENAYCIQTVNGATICALNDESTSYITKIVIDTNGPDIPNIVGVDTFVAQININGQISDLSNDIEDCGKNPNGTDVINTASGCLTKVINNSWVITD